MRRVRRILKGVAEAGAVMLMAALFGAFLVQVFWRYVLNAPLGWTAEACVMLYIWAVFWSTAFLLRERDHVAFTMLSDTAPPAVRRVLALVGTVLVGVGFAASLPAVLDYLAFMRIDVTPVTRIRFDLVYSIFAVFVVALVVRAVLRTVRLLRRDWRQELDPAPESGSRSR